MVESWMKVAAAAEIVELPLFMRMGLAALLFFAYYVRRTLYSGGALEDVPSVRGGLLSCRLRVRVRRSGRSSCAMWP
jgi:hypothetical protein